MLVDRITYLLTMGEIYAWIALLEIAFPMLMWRDYLRRKPMGERFMFCVLTQTAFLVNAVIFLGVLKICNRWTILLSLVLEYAAVRWTFSDKQQVKRLRAFIHLIKRLLSGEVTIQHVLRTLHGRFTRIHLHNKRQRTTSGWLRKHYLQVLIGAIILTYNAFFLTHNVNIYHSYQFSDIPVHTSWVYALEQGTVFVAGVYPFAMHAMIYVVRVLSNISLREIMLYFGSFHALLMFSTLYLFSRKLFRSKYASALTTIALTLMLNQGRFGASLPQECGVFAMFTMGYYLIKYLETPRERHLVQGDSKFRACRRINQYWSRQYLNFDFFMIALSVAQIIAFHFYTAIAAVMLAVAIVGTHLFTFLKKQYLVPIVTAAVTGAMIAIIPFMFALANGIPFQESMNWALSVMQGTEWEGTGTGYVITDESGATTELQDLGKSDEQVEETDPLHSDISTKEKLLIIGQHMFTFNDEYIYGPKTTPLFLFCLGCACLFGFVFLFFPRLRRWGMNYLAIACFVLLMIILGISAAVGLPVLLEPSRASVFLGPVLIQLLGVPLDILFVLLQPEQRPVLRRIMACFSTAVCAAMCYWIVQSGVLHNYFDVNLAYYNDPDYVIRQIQNQFPAFSYTIVSPTDEYYTSVEFGYHTELSEIVSITEGTTPEYIIPTQYVFFFIEKYTLQDYFHGRDWVSEDYAAATFNYQASTQDYYFQRNTMESKAFYWAQAYAQLYPNNMKVYFESDIYIVYCLEQEVKAPLSIRLPDFSEMN